MQPTYWLDLFTHQTWTEFLAAEGTISGFREKRWRTVQAMRPGDILLCYLTGVSRWIGLLEVTGPAFKDSAPIWKVSDFPARVPVKVLARLDPLHGVPVVEMRQLSIFQNLKSPHAWTGRFRGSPQKWLSADGEAVFAAVREAEAHPVERPFDPAKLKKVPPILKMSKLGAVTVPEDEEEPEREIAQEGQRAATSVTPTILEAEPKEANAHSEIQWLLLKLGSDMGLDVWVAKNDKNKAFNGQSFASIPKLKGSLPLQFDEATTRTIELIDVIWLKGNSIQAALR